MYHQGRIGIAVSILVCFMLQAQGADKNTDENRPYEFGFNVEIDGSKQQHRHEKKDKDGIIMGEFGFVTADDVYHVTVYATDKEGRFKILSMKNIHLKSSPGAGAALSARQGHSLALPAPAQANAPTPQPQTSVKSVSLEPPGRSCSSCSIPTSTRVPPPAPSANFAPPNEQPFPPSAPAQSNNAQVGSPNYSQQQPAFPPQLFSQQPDQSQQNFPGSPSNYGQSGPLGQTPAQLGQRDGQQYSNGQTPAQLGQRDGQQYSNGQTPAQLGQRDGQQYSNGASPGQNTAPQSGRTSKQYTGPEQQFNSNLPQNGQSGPVKPTLVSAQMQIVDKNTDIHALRPGEKQGLPAGLTKDDMTELLYTFNYTVGFHGHFEEGYRNGAKKGYYFVTGRNGVKTRIDYTADDTGFHPRVSQEVLDLLSDDVPKPETEKDEKYGLKGYEFKWLYYPVDSNKP